MGTLQKQVGCLTSQPLRPLSVWRASWQLQLLWLPFSLTVCRAWGDRDAGTWKLLIPEPLLSRAASKELNRIQGCQTPTLPRKGKLSALNVALSHSLPAWQWPNPWLPGILFQAGFFSPFPFFERNKKFKSLEFPRGQIYTGWAYGIVVDLHEIQEHHSRAPQALFSVTGFIFTTSVAWLGMFCQEFLTLCEEIMPGLCGQR